jgi:integrase-like protein
MTSFVKVNFREWLSPIANRTRQWKPVARCSGVFGPGDQRAVSSNSIRRAINEILMATGLTDAAGQPLRFQAYDFRRLFTTEAIMNGMPPHIAQLLLGHKDINTTMGYKAVYPEEAINGHRALAARRRALRPSEEYRTRPMRNGTSSSATSSGARSPSANAAEPTAQVASTSTVASDAQSCALTLVRGDGWRRFVTT